MKPARRWVPIPAWRAIDGPVVRRGQVGDVLIERVERGAGDVGGKALAVEEGFGVGDARKQGADGVAVSAEFRMAVV